jgi:hypothetical protein
VHRHTQKKTKEPDMNDEMEKKKKRKKRKNTTTTCGVITGSNILAMEMR